jgi:hypothetical protein
MAVINPQSIDDLSVLNDTIKISPSYSVDYGAIPTISIADLTLGNIAYSSSGTSTTYTLGAGGSHANAVWTTTAVPGTGINWSAVGAVQPSATISLKGKDADIDIDGKSLVKWMEAMEERMNWMQPNTELEKEWDELKELGNQYRKLEAQCRDKAAMWNKLKSMPKPEIE